MRPSVAVIEPGTTQWTSLGAAVVMDILKNCGADPYWVSGRRDRQGCLFPAPAQFDAVFLSVYSPRQIPTIPAALKRVGVALDRTQRNPDAPLVVVGGQSVVSNPSPFWPIADLVSAGDGESTIPGIIHELTEGGKWAVVEAASGIGTASPSQHENITPLWEGSIPARLVYSGKFARNAQIEITRGCRHSCAFCQIGHISPYREASRASVVSILDSNNLRKLNLSSPNFQDHRYSSGLVDECNKRNIYITNRNSQAREFEGRAALTIGLDAPSERLRRAVGKSVWRTKEILEIAALPYSLMKVNIIVGYPGETRDDRAECSELIKQLISIRGGGGMDVYTGLLIPYPHTAFEQERDEVRGMWPSAAEWIAQTKEMVKSINLKRTRRNVRFLNPPTVERASEDDRLSWLGAEETKELRVVMNCPTNRTRKRFARRSEGG